METNPQAVAGAFVLSLMMIGIGMTLTIKDFSRLFEQPKAVMLGSFLQLVFLPLAGAGVVVLFDLPAALALGAIVLAACPGGAGSNVLSYICKGNTALSVTLTAISSLAATVTIPLILGIALSVLYRGEDASINILATSLQVMALTVIPVVIGMLINRFATNFAERSKKPIKIAASALMILFVIVAVTKDFDTLTAAAFQITAPMALLSFIATIGGLLTAILFRLAHDDIVTLGIEVGIQNSLLALTICIVVLDNVESSIAPLIYQPISMAVAGSFLVYSFFIRKDNSGSGTPQEA